MVKKVEHYYCITYSGGFSACGFFSVEFPKFKLSSETWDTLNENFWLPDLFTTLNADWWPVPVVGVPEPEDKAVEPVCFELCAWFPASTETLDSVDCWVVTIALVGWLAVWVKEAGFWLAKDTVGSDSAGVSVVSLLVLSIM